MPDLPDRVHPSPFKYSNRAFRRAAEEAKSRSRGRCQRCGRQLPLEAHHYARPYPPASQTKAAYLTAFCSDCHDDADDFCFYLEAGGSPAVYRAAVSKFMADHVRPADDGRRVGRVVSVKDRWGAIVSGESTPRVGEVFWLLLRTRHQWVTVAVTDVVDGRPGHWRVHKRFLPVGEAVRMPCARGGDAGRVAA